MENIKTRDLSLYDFFSKLQEEYVCAEVRKKIYTKPKDKGYWQRVMDGKAIKIKDIALRNSLPSIFTSESLKEKVYYRIINKQGFPNFVYKNEAERLEIEFLDFVNYYRQGCEFKLDVDGDEICTLTYINTSTKEGKIKLKSGLEKDCELSVLTRIL